MRIAAVDIGTVTTRLLVAERDGAGHIEVLERDLEITQLGKGLAESGRLSTEGIAAVCDALARFKREIERLGADLVVPIATSAARDASNGDEFLETAAATGIKPLIVPGRVEAALSFAGATYGRDVHNLLVMDPGGGSTEYIYAGSGEDTPITRSIDIGSRRLTDMFFHHDPPLNEELEEARAYIVALVSAYRATLPEAPEELVAVAGTATSLVTMLYKMDVYDPALVHGQVVSTIQVEDLFGMLRVLTEAERREVAGLEPKRAGVILAGELIILETLRLFDLGQVTISDNDLLYGIVLQAEAVLGARL